MKEKRLHKSRCEGILNNFIEARCSCGNCRCSVCPCTHSTQYAGMQSGEVTNTLFCFVQLFLQSFRLTHRSKRTGRAKSCARLALFQTNDLNGGGFP